MVRQHHQQAQRCSTEAAVTGAEWKRSALNHCEAYNGEEFFRNDMFSMHIMI